MVCCSDTTTGTSLSPAKLLANNTGSGESGDPEQFGYWWRVRAVDPDGNSGEWNYGQPFDKTYPASIASLHLRDNLGDAATDLDPATAVVDTSAPAIVWHQVPGASSYEVQVVPYVQIPNTSVSVCNWSLRVDRHLGRRHRRDGMDAARQPRLAQALRRPHEPAAVRATASHQPQAGTSVLRTRARRGATATRRTRRS